MSLKIKPLGEDLITGEARTLEFTYVDEDGAAENMTGSSFELTIRENFRDAAAVTIADASFDKTNIASGIVTCPISAVQNTRTGQWYFLLWTDYAAGDAVGQYYTVNYLDKG